MDMLFYYTIICMYVPTAFLEEIRWGVVELVDCDNQMKLPFSNSKFLMIGGKNTEFETKHAFKSIKINEYY